VSDRLKPSRMELRLEAEIAGAATAIETDCKRAELAGYHARLGRFDEARSTLAALHQRYDSRPNVAISSWVNLVEGLIGHFSDMDPAARDKVLRAHALSTAAGLTSMRALSAAWLAHMDYCRLDVLAMSEHVRESFRLSILTHDETRSRACMVVAQALHLSGKYTQSVAWYQRVRLHANRNGDDATMGAMLHNMAWLHMATMRQEKFTGIVDSAVASFVLLSAESTKNFDEIFGLRTLPSLVPILRAQVLSLMGQTAEALLLYEAHLHDSHYLGATRFRATLLADQAWCRISVGDDSGALQDAIAAASSLCLEVQIDDLAAAHTRLSQVFSALGNVTDAEHHGFLASKAWNTFYNLQIQISVNLDGLSENYLD
jgi:hypothetical protein